MRHRIPVFMTQERRNAGISQIDFLALRNTSGGAELRYAKVDILPKFRVTQPFSRSEWPSQCGRQITCGSGKLPVCSRTVPERQNDLSQKLRIALAKQMPKVEVTVFLVSAKRLVAALPAQNHGHSLLPSALHDRPLRKCARGPQRLVVVEDQRLDALPELVTLGKCRMIYALRSGGCRDHELALVDRPILETS